MEAVQIKTCDGMSRYRWVDGALIAEAELMRALRVHGLLHEWLELSAEREQLLSAIKR